MTKKFEEEFKRPANTGIDPFSKRDVDFSKLAAKFQRGAQTLKEWKEYALLLEDKLDCANERVKLLEGTVDELKQLLPEVPDFVASWIECVKGKNNNALALLDDDNMPDDVNEWLFFQRNDDNINLILRAWLDGYTVQKPQLFYLKHIDMSKSDKECDWYLVNDGDLDHDFEYKGLRPSQDRYKFTQEEIDSMHTGSYEQLEVEVAE